MKNIMLSVGRVCCQKKVVTSSQVNKAKCNHDRDDQVGDVGRTWGGGGVVQMSAPEDENAFGRLLCSRRDNVKGEKDEIGGVLSHLIVRI